MTIGPETPAMTDPEKILNGIANIANEQAVMQNRLDEQAKAINMLGENMQWLVNNTQGIFQMFNSPAFMSQMTNALMGGINGSGPSTPDPAPAAGAPEGADA